MSEEMMCSIEEELSRKKTRKPLGLKLYEVITRRKLSYQSCQAIVLVLTFLSYTCYHMSRKITSVVKSALDPQSSSHAELHLFSWKRTHSSNTSSQEGWSPFNGDNGTELLGVLDVSFLAVYAIGMYFSGQIGDRMDLRVFLTVGMIGTSVFTTMFGLGYWANIHAFSFFLAMQMLAGLFQSSGWPSVVAVVGNWFGKSKRGLIMGIWNAHTSIGNITGSLLASAMLAYGWGWSFVVPSLVMFAIGIAIWWALPVSPNDFEFERGNEEKESQPLLEPEEEKAVGFLAAWRIPGVAAFSLCLFFAKLVAYTFLYWLPFYISHNRIGGAYLSSEEAGNLSTIFDVGGVLGGILAGYISDKLEARAVTAAVFMYAAIPVLYFYRTCGEVSLAVNVGLMFVTGMVVNGPYALITTAVSADLGTHGSLRGDAKALATVTAIIDGTGSLGAAVGPLLTGYISSKSWSAVFTMLMGAAFVAGLMLTKLVVAEVKLIVSWLRCRSIAASDDSHV